VLHANFADVVVSTCGLTYCHTMSRAKIAITVDERALAETHRLVEDGMFSEPQQGDRGRRPGENRQTASFQDCP
jgi:hypothetical protein